MIRYVMQQAVHRYLMAAFQLLVLSNVYIALCAMVMCQTTAWLFHRQLPNSFLGFIFVGTLGSYCLHEYLTDTSAADVSSTQIRRERWLATHKQELLVLFLSSLLVGGWLLTRLSAYLTYLLPVVVLTFLYTAPKINWRPFLALRQIAILKTTYLALVWTYVTVALPILLTNPSYQANQANWILVVNWLLNRFLLIYSVALCFDYRDRTVDRQSNWLTIVSRLTGRQVRLFFGLIALCFGLTATELYWLGWDEWTLLCVILPMVILLLVARRIVSREAGAGYYVLLDGLLMLTGILLNLVSVFH